MSHGFPGHAREANAVHQQSSPLRRVVANLWLLALVGLTPALIAEDAPPAKKAALLVGVNKYLKPGFRDLQFAEADVVAVGEELRKLGFEVTLLLGSETSERQATKANIEAAARRIVAPLGKEDVALVMLSGHGQQLHPDPHADPNTIDFEKTQSYYCPVDALVNRPESQVSLGFLLDEILAPNVGRKILLVDACRDIPEDRTRGGRNTKGIEGRVITLPEDTAVFFSCRAGQMSFERHELGHGLFTYCVLEGLRREAVSPSGEITWARLVAHVNERMVSEELTKLMPQRLRQVPIPAGALPHTVLGKLEVSPPAAIPAPRVAPAPTPDTSSQLDGELQGKQPGEVREFTNLRIKMCWCPPGSFTMGSPTTEAGRGTNEDQVQVTLSRGFWLGQTEVTREQWLGVIGTTPWTLRVGESGFAEGQPVTDVSWEDATEFCRRLTKRAHDAGRLPSGWSYQLPTEAQWEYACRAGTSTPYNGEGTGVLSDYAWYAHNTWYPGRIPSPSEGGLARAVSQKRPNRWGLFDMHGNVWEWCQDWYREKLPGGRDPLISTGESYRVNRGGSWLNSAESCRSATRMGTIPSKRSYTQGFRLALSAAEE